MSETIEVHMIHDSKTHLVGRCRYITKAQRQTSIFEYADEWLADDEAFALDPANLPLGRSSICKSSEKSALPGAVRDTTPDCWGRQLIRRAFRKSGEIRTLSEIDYLLGLSDETRVGALRFRREGELQFGRQGERHQIPPLIQLPALLHAADAIQDNRESAADLKLLLSEGSPLGGARPKSAVVDSDGHLAIAKFSKPDDDRSIPHGEILALNLARQAGISAATGRLLTVAGRPVALIRRFDRKTKNRLAFLSAMSLLGLNDGDAATYIDIAECIRMYSAAPREDLHELWRRIIFGVMVGNLDDHLRNHGFLHAGNGKWRLSPAYDLNPVPIEEKMRELTTWISEEGPQASIDLARRSAPFFALDDGQAQRIIDEVSQAVSKWQTLARQLHMTGADQEAYASAFEWNES